MIGCLWGKESDAAQLLEIGRSLSPIVEQIGKGSILIDVQTAPPIDELKKKFPAIRVGLAHNRFIAECAAITAPAGNLVAVPKGEEARFLAPLPISFLPMEEETARRMQLIGIKDVGQLAALSKDELYMPFGEEGISLWELANGIDQRPLNPTPQEETLSLSHELDGPLTPDLIVHLLQRLFAMLEERTLLCLKLRLLFDDYPIDIAFSTGSRSVAAAWRLIESKLTKLPLTHDVQKVTLTCTRVVRTTTRQLSLFDAKWERHLPEAIACLRAKGDPYALMRIVWDNPICRIPERRAHLQSLLSELVTAPLLAPKTLPHKPSGTILDTWEIDEEWWTKAPIRRRYHRLVTATGGYLRIFKEAQNWFAQ